MKKLPATSRRDYFSDMIGEGKKFRSRKNCAEFLGLSPSKATKFFDILPRLKSGDSYR